MLNKCEVSTNQPTHQVRQICKAHKARTQNQPCKRACLVPTLLGHTLSNRTQYAGGQTLMKGERTTGGLPKYGQTETVFQLLFFNLASYRVERY